ncbi:MAG: L-lactate dehydrogenase [Myxococcota bacterium]
MRVGIIGLGWVGSSVAISVLQRGVARELLLFDVKEGLAEGEAMDLSHGAAYLPTATVRAASSLEEFLDLDAIVIAAGRGGTAEESRLDLNRGNATILRSITGQLRGSKGLIVVLTNPVDVMVRVAQQASERDPTQVIGTGTMLETARLRYAVGRDLGLDPLSVHAQVVGEHGDTNVPLWSGARIGGRPLRQWPGWTTDRERALAEEVRTAAYDIIRRKGVTNHAIGLVTASLLGWTSGRADRVLTVSRVREAFDGVALSVPTLVGKSGATELVAPEMDEGETAALQHSAEVLDAAWNDVR